MNAVEFVKKFGMDLARRDIAAWQSGFIKREDFLEHYGFDILDDLKQIIEAWELVESYGGIAEASCYVFEETGEDCYYNKSLEEAINLVEKCNA